MARGLENGKLSHFADSITQTMGSKIVLTSNTNSILPAPKILMFKVRPIASAQPFLWKGVLFA